MIDLRVAQQRIERALRIELPVVNARTRILIMRHLTQRGRLVVAPRWKPDQRGEAKTRMVESRNPADKPEHEEPRDRDARDARPSAARRVRGRMRVHIAFCPNPCR